MNAKDKMLSYAIWPQYRRTGDELMAHDKLDERREKARVYLLSRGIRDVKPLLRVKP